MSVKRVLFILIFATNVGLLQAQTPADSSCRQTDHKWRISGLGESIARFYPHNQANFSIPRFAVTAEFKPSDRWTINGEIEFTTENREEPYSLELNVDYKVCPALQIRAGHLPVHVGLFNSDDCPTTHFTTADPEGETAILPSGWTEAGAGILGEFGKNKAFFRYAAMAILPLFEPKHRAAPGYAARLNWHGVPDLCLGGSLYFQPKMADGITNSTPTNKTYWSLDAVYNGKTVIIRACAIGEHTGKSRLQSRAFGGETGLKLMEITGNKKLIGLTPFVRYDYYQAPENEEDECDTRIPTSLATAGVNLSPLPWLLVKADYSARFHHSCTKKCGHEVAIALVLTGDFWKK